MNKLKFALGIISGRIKPSPMEDWLKLIEYQWFNDTSERINKEQFIQRCEEIVYDEIKSKITYGDNK